MILARRTGCSGPGVVIRAVTHKIRLPSTTVMLIRNVALVLFCAISSGLAQGQQPAPTPSVVYALRNPDSIKQYKTNPHIVREMVNRLVMAVTGQSDVAKSMGIAGLSR